MAVNVKTWEAPPVKRREILRYAGVRESAPEVEALMDECLRVTENKLRFQVCWAQFAMEQEAEELNLGFTRVRSRSLALNLQGCKSIVVFAATIGVEMDRLIARYTRLSPAMAHMLQAVGVERIESLCDAFNAEIVQTLGPARPRFSPGYGDVPLEMQREILRMLNAPRNIGVSLNDSLLMSPSKSVTAIIGLGSSACESPCGCAACEKTGCAYRREA